MHAQQGAWEAELVKSECTRAGDLSPALGAAFAWPVPFLVVLLPAAALDGCSWGERRP